MKRRFKTKKKRKHQVLFLLLLSIVTFYISYRFLFLHLIKKYIKEENLIIYLTSTEENKNIKDPLNLINYSFNNMISEKTLKKETIIPVIQTENKPIIYLYNTHQEEKYSKEYLEIYNITPTVLTASYILEENLNKLGLQTITEEKKISSILKENNLSYKDSYEASRILMTNAKNIYPSLSYFIDIHRDSSAKEKTTIEIQGKSYARILFVIGKEHENYKENLELANKINDELKNFNELISRGVYIKEGIYVNGIYNQDFNPNTILIEIGGVDNNIEEVNNTMEILANALTNTIGGYNEKGR